MENIILEFLKVILTWPVIALVLGFVIIFRFGKQIERFLDDNNITKAGPFSFTQKQEDLNDIEKKKSDMEKKKELVSPKKSGNITKQDLVKENEFLKEKSNLFEFSYLDLALVGSTKSSLKWLLYNPNGVTKDLFEKIMPISPEVVDIIAEKEAIYSALLSSNLIDEEKGIVNITKKGRDFLEFINKTLS